MKKKKKKNWRWRTKISWCLKKIKTKLKAIKYNNTDDNENLSKYKNFFDELSNERVGEINNASKQIDFNNLAYCVKVQNIAPINFISFKGPMHIYNNIENGNKSVEK